MKITKKNLEMSLLGIVIIVLLVFIGNSIFNWTRKKSATKELLKWIKVSIIEIDNTAPPGLMIEVENNEPRVIGRTHFRLVFSVGDKTVCRVDTDYGNFKPNEKRRILLKCSESNYSSRYRGWKGNKVSYTLQVFPEWKEPLEPLRGEFILK